MKRETDIYDLDHAQNGVDALPSEWRGKISDGYHTFNELYEHRIVLYIALLKSLMDFSNVKPIWKSKKHSNGEVWDGWFILGYDTEPGYQITYHIPNHKWSDCSFATEYLQAPEFDGHTSEDVLNRLKNL